MHTRNCKAGCLTWSQRRRRGPASSAVAAGSGLNEPSGAWRSRPAGRTYRKRCGKSDKTS